MKPPSWDELARMIIMAVAGWGLLVAAVWAISVIV